MKVEVRQLLALTIVAIEFTWAYPWVLLVSGTFYGPSAAPLLPPASAFALLTLAYLAVRAAVTRPWSLRDTRVMIVAAGFLSGMTAVRLAYYPGRGPLDFRWIGTLLLAAHDALPAITPAVMAALLATVLWWRGVVLSEREFGYFEGDRASAPAGPSGGGPFLCALGRGEGGRARGRLRVRAAAVPPDDLPNAVGGASVIS